MKRKLNLFVILTLLIWISSCESQHNQNTKKFSNKDSSIIIELPYDFTVTREITGKVLILSRKTNNQTESVVIEKMPSSFNFKDYVSQVVLDFNKTSKKLTMNITEQNDTLITARVTGSSALFQAYKCFYYCANYVLTSTSSNKKNALNHIKYFEPIVFQTEEYQTFLKEGFKIKNCSRLTVNDVFITAAKQYGVKNLIAAYVCADNEDDFNLATIINVNVYELSGNFLESGMSDFAIFEKKYLDDYVKDLKSAKIKFKFSRFKNIKALEYDFDQLGLPTKAILFIYDKKQFLIQIGTRTNLNEKYNSLIMNFEFI